MDSLLNVIWETEGKQGIEDYLSSLCKLNLKKLANEMWLYEWKKYNYLTFPFIWEKINIIRKD